MGTEKPRPRQGPAEGPPSLTRFDHRVWHRYNTVVQVGAVSKAVLFPGLGFWVVISPSRSAAMRKLREIFPLPERASNRCLSVGAA